MEEQQGPLLAPPRCCLCAEASGRPDQEWLCSLCYRKRMSQQAVDREELPQSPVAKHVLLSEAVQEALDAVAKPRVACGERSGVAGARLGAVWPGSRAA